MNTAKKRLQRRLLHVFLWGLGVPLGMGYMQCGVPDPLENNAILPPYEFKAYTSNQTISFIIRGYYPSDQVPFFSGFNLYYGETSSYADINRRIYTDERLPTIEAAPTEEGYLDINFTLNLITYKIQNEDDFETESINLHQSYFFILKAINSKTGQEGPHYNRQAEARPCVKVFNAGATQNSEVILNLGSIRYSFAGGHMIPRGETRLLSGGYQDKSIREIHAAPIESQVSLYTSSPSPMQEGYGYYLKQGENYAFVYIVAMTESNVTYHYFYQEGSSLF